MPKLRIGALASHNGTTLQSVIDACESGNLLADIALVISNNSSSGAAQRAHHHGLAFVHLSGKSHPGEGMLDRAICAALEENAIDLVLLAGYMKKLGPQTLKSFAGRIINTHPTLLPAFGGVGMYGNHVHEAVLASGVSTTGVTIHLVNDSYDTGAIVAQREVKVSADDSVETLSQRVQTNEKLLLVEVLADIAVGRTNLGNY